MTNPARPYGGLAALIFLALASAGHVSAQSVVESRSIGLGALDLRRAQDRAVAQARIDDAALAVCGAPEGSLPVVRDEVRRSACWKDAVAKAERQLETQSGQPRSR